jgi:hypothetical protein
MHPLSHKKALTLSREVDGCKPRGAGSGFDNNRTGYQSDRNTGGTGYDFRGGAWQLGWPLPYLGSRIPSESVRPSTESVRIRNQF